MNRYFPGQRIRCRGQDWQVTGAKMHQIANGGAVYEVEALGLTGIVRGQFFVFMDDIDVIEVIDPSDIEPTAPSNAQTARLFWEAHLRRLLPRNGALYIGQHGAVNPYDYQYVPAAHALNLPRPRILLGDAVGLGKTIECGILLSELIRRGKGQRVLCAVPKAILEQFQMEMWGRFAIPFHRLDSKGLERLRQDLPSTMNPFYNHDKAIISIDTLKLKKYQRLLENCDWDVLIIDECHNVADRTDGAGGSARHRTARRLTERANAVILMSATPHDGTKQGFASLIKLLDRTKIKNDENYSREDFVDHFIRRSRMDVASQLTERGRRQQKVEKIPMRPAEIDLLQSLHDAQGRTEEVNKPVRRGAEELFRTTLIKSFLSSPQALRQTAENKLKTLAKRKSAPNTDTEGLAQVLRDIVADLDALKGFSRLDYLTDYIKKNPIAKDNRLVIFTERIATMNAIVDHLIKSGVAKGKYDLDADKQKKGVLVASASGSMGDVKLNQLVKAFQSGSSDLHILVATNVASEGLNLHHNCHRLIHFDLPWSLITLEQRNGRIDRLGQTKTPEIFYFASVAGDDTRETDVKALKDDFWVMSHIERRIEQSNQDMDEDVRLNYADSETEEENHVERYQEGKALEDEDFNPALALLDGEDVKHDDSKPKHKELATLYEKSPSDFVKGVCKQAKIASKEKGSEVKIAIDNAMRFEIAQWPSEFRPIERFDDDESSHELALEMNIANMEKHYNDMLNKDFYLEKTFMNEIHPAIALLENVAMGFFPGKEVPTIALKGVGEGTLHFLIQSTLFNQCNDVIEQYWQVIEHKKGSSKLKPLFDIQDKDHAAKIADWLNTSLKGAKSKGEVTDNERDRIRNQAQKAIDIMISQTKDAREVMASSIRPYLKKENDRIKDWEKERKRYLKSFIEAEELAGHAGEHAIIHRAKEELEKIGWEKQRYNDFINRFFAPTEEPDIRILGCFMGEG